MGVWFFFGCSMQTNIKIIETRLMHLCVFIQKYCCLYFSQEREEERVVFVWLYFDANLTAFCIIFGIQKLAFYKREYFIFNLEKTRYIWFFGKKTWTSILIYIIWKNASKKLVKYYETYPKPNGPYSWTQKVEKSKKVLTWFLDLLTFFLTRLTHPGSVGPQFFFDGIVFSEVNLPGKRKKNFENFFFIHK
jgi:hypothetical protein